MAEKKLKRFVYKDKGADGKVSYRVKFEYQDRNGDVKAMPKARFRTRAEAKTQLEKWVAEDALKRGKLQRENEKLRFADYAKEYEADLLSKISKTSHAGEKIRIREAVQFFGNRTVESITRRDVKAYRLHLINTPVRKEVWTERENKQIGKSERVKVQKETKREIATVNRYLQRLRAMLNEAAADDDSLPLVNFKDLIQTGLETKRKETLTFAEFERLLIACTGRCKHLKIYLLGLWELGCREAEAQNIRRRDVHLEENTVAVSNSKIKPGKPKTQRLCYLSNYLKNALIENGIQNLAPDDYVFPRGDFKHSFATVKERAGIRKEFREQDLRHCTATNLHHAGVDKITIKRQLGHAAINDLTESVYINIRDEKLVREMKKYEAFSKEQRENLTLEAEIIGG